MGVLGEVNNTWSLKRLLVILLIRFRFHCILEIILNLWSLDFCKRFLRVFFYFGVLIFFGLIVFSKLYKFSKLVMYLNSCSTNLGRDSDTLSQHVCWVLRSINLLKYYQLIFNKVTDKVEFCLYMLRLWMKSRIFSKKDCTLTVTM